MTGASWDAATYDRVADPQEARAREILARPVILHGVPDAADIAAKAAGELDVLDYVRLNMEAIA